MSAEVEVELGAEARPEVELGAEVRVWRLEARAGAEVRVEARAATGV